jgi:ABC-2 type transport system ATP-binding protein
MNEHAISVRGIRKSYGEVNVLDGVDLAVPTGSVLALLGPNGAGKTTMVRLLSTLVTPDAGAASVAGFDVVAQPREVRRRISLTGQYAAVDELQTGRENLQMMGRLAHLGQAAARRRADELLAEFDLVAAMNRRVATYSGGMRRRLDLASSLVGRPSVIFLDEPTSGLDPRSRQQMWEVVRGLAASGVTILLTTQHLEEADHLAGRIAVLDEGRIVAEGTGAELKAAVAGRRLDLVLADADAFRDASGILGDRVIHRDDALRTLGVGTDGTGGHVHRVLDELVARRIGVASLSVHTASLDDVFMALTGRSTDAQESSHA